MKIGFTAPREGLTHYQKMEIISLLRDLQPKEVHLGLCRGGDEEIHNIVTAGLSAPEGLVDCKIIGHPPVNKKDYVHKECYEMRPDKEYLDRNKDIVDETYLLVGCPKGEEVLRSGTWSTIRYARKQGKEVIIIPPNFAEKEINK